MNPPQGSASELSSVDPPALVRLHFAAQHTPAYFVGGCVRDALLGRPFTDTDVVVESEAWSHAEALAASTGGAFVGLDRERDCARVVWTGASRAHAVDIARMAGPTLDADLRKRDFTINAMATPVRVDLKGELDDADIVDPTDGQSDLRAALVRMTSAEVFQSDPLRLLRGPRLAAELGFSIDAATRDAIAEHSSLLKEPAAERVREELARLLELAELYSWMLELSRLGLLVAVLPEVEPHLRALPGRGESATPQVRSDLRALQSIAGYLRGDTDGEDLPPQSRLVLAPFRDRLAELLADRSFDGHSRLAWLRLALLIGGATAHGPDGKKEGVEAAAGAAQRLRLSRGLTEYLVAAVGHYRAAGELAAGSPTGPVERRSVYRYYKATGQVGIDIALLALARSWGAGDEVTASKVPEVVAELLAAWYSRRDELVAPRPLVDGEELMAALGLRQGPDVGRLLDHLVEAQAAGDVATRDDALALARDLLRRWRS